METAAAAVEGTGGESGGESQTTETQSVQSTETKTEVNEGSEQSYRLHELEEMEERGEQDSITDEADLQLLEDRLRGKIKPVKRPGENKAEEEKTETTENPIWKELGAKSEAEVLPKLQELKKLIGGRDSQAVANISKALGVAPEKAIETATALQEGAKYVNTLFNNARNGDAAAVKELATRFGFQPIGQQQQQTQQTQPNGGYEVDADADILTNGLSTAHKKALDEIASLKEAMGKFDGRFKELSDKEKLQTATKTAASKVMDEAMEISQFFPELKGVNRERLDAWLNHGKEDPALDTVFNPLFQIAHEKGYAKVGLGLTHAYHYMRGKDVDLLLKQAEERGRASAFKHSKPNPSLSSSVVGTAEGGPEMTESQIAELEGDDGAKIMARDHKDWFDPKSGDPIKAKIPAKVYNRLFG